VNVTTYRCSICQTVSEHDADDNSPVCNTTDDCGLLFEDEIVKPEAPAKSAAPSKRSIKFSLIGEGHLEGDDREYEVHVHGQYIGIVSAEQRPAVHQTANEDHFIDGFGFGGEIDGTRSYGWGKTRAAAVIDAFTD
jgi:hypothetical protein